MKVLITGSNGQLAHDCRMELEKQHAVAGWDLPELDITSMESVRVAFREVGPEVVVNCAAYTRVDAAENDRESAQKVNGNGPGNLAAAAREAGAFLVHISTDYVFDGARPIPRPYVEDDPTGPTGWYGATKLAGEQAVTRETDRYAILRTAWLYGASGHNFPKTMLKLALKNRERPFRVVNDQYGSPTWSFRLAEQIARVIAADGQGVYHATAEGYCTWYEFAQRFLTAMQVPFAIEPCATRDYPTPARRPANSILENKRLKEQGINIMRPWQDDVDEFVARHREALLLECGAVLQ